MVPAIIILSAVISILLLQSKFFLISDITLSPQNLSCATKSQVINQSGLLGKSIFLIKNEEVKKNLKKFLCIGDVSVTKNYPRTLQLDVTERKPVLILNILKPKKIDLDSPESSNSSAEATLASGEKFAVDKSGFVFSKAEVAGITNIDWVTDNIKEGDSVDIGVINNCLQIIAAIKDKQLIRNINVWGENITVNATEKLTFSGRKDIGLQLISLQLIQQKAKMSSEVIQSADFRFDKPVVVYYPKNLQ